MYTQGYQPYTIGNGTFHFSVNGTIFMSQEFTYNAANYHSYENPVKQKHPEAIITKADLPDI